MSTVINTINIIDVIKITQKAGDIILEIYNSDFSVEYKDDRSPLTLADKKANVLIIASLKELYPDIPILSEETQAIAYEERESWEYFWLVDPLDGTKEFIKRNGEFTVNIALIQKDTPVMGVIYVPVKGALYFASQDEGAYKVERVNDTADYKNLDELLAKASRLPLATSKECFTVIGSRSHMSKETEDYIENLKRRHGKVDMISAGSSLKFCLVAEGKADVYPRFAPTMEWDTAAGHMIAQEAGAKVTDARSHAVLRYNKENLLNSWFMVESKNDNK